MKKMSVRWSLAKSMYWRKKNEPKNMIEEVIYKQTNKHTNSTLFLLSRR